ncbi:hypothetical protein E4T38_03994 [Aureobasidium subglaciale]|nr:hypothetical protein E4T38_03994 [Aureobasidium subglaciale]KAI5224896.1 hypothetical protein E4T40_03769 [Aureobasidium subglaciale]KAI5228011.1 hypothetical protein E4T41_03989 [Aureobasidium subglaciale]KAI5263533.1 hypothetical protein E4T46_03610 [Aureobasidium subglaciale]
MAPHALPGTFWSEQIDAAADMLGKRDEEGGISKLKSLLLDSRLPCYWRIRAYAFLAKASEDWYEAEVSRIQVQDTPMLTMSKDYQYAAEILWTSTRNLIPFKQDDDFDEVTDENRFFLNRLAVQMDTEMPEDLRTFRKRSDGEGEQAEVGETSSTSDDNEDQDDGQVGGVSRGVVSEEEEAKRSDDEDHQEDIDQEVKHSENAKAEEMELSATLWGHPSTDASPHISVRRSTPTTGP